MSPVEEILREEFRLINGLDSFYQAAAQKILALIPKEEESDSPYYNQALTDVRRAMEG